VLDALRASRAYENTIAVFTSDHGDMQGAHGGRHEQWHVAYDEALRVPFVVSSPLLPVGAGELDISTNDADLIPTVLGLASIDTDQALIQLQAGHVDARLISSSAVNRTGSARATGSAPRPRWSDATSQTPFSTPSSPRSASTASPTSSTSPATTTTCSSGPSRASATSAFEGSMKPASPFHLGGEVYAGDLGVRGAGLQAIERGPAARGIRRVRADPFAPADRRRNG
jgi:hypothetical protein